MIFFYQSLYSNAIFLTSAAKAVCEYYGMHVM